jgi:hypothetical protein
MALQQHDLVLAEGRFRVVLTDRRRLFAVLDAPETALGPLRVALEIDRRPLLDAPTARDDSRRAHVVAGTRDERALAPSSDPAFRLVSSAAPAIARSAFATLRDAVDHGALRLSERLEQVPEVERAHVAAGARIILRARLGDVGARRFIGRVVAAVRDGSPTARPIRDSLVAGSRLVDDALRTSSSALSLFRNLVDAIQRGDLRGAEALVNDARAKAIVAETELLDDYVSLFAKHNESSLRGDERELLDATSLRFVQPLSRVLGTTTTTGFDIGGAIGIASDAASGNVAGAVGGAGSALGGNLAKGAAIGSAIGTVIPVVGTAIGGAVGAVIGGIGSLFGHHHHSGPLDYEHLLGGVGTKLVRNIADKLRSAPRWQAHFQAVYRHLPAGTANVKGLGDLVAHELFPHDEHGKDATTGHADGLAEWFAEQPDWEQLIHSQGVPPGDRHQLEARVRAVMSRRDVARKARDTLVLRSPPTKPAPPIREDLLPTWEPIAALPITTGCACDPKPAGES